MQQSYIPTTIQLGIMLSLQDQMNYIVHPEWKAQNFDWKLAASQEVAEFADHIGWKWWKKTEPNYAQAKMEIVDIWHFALSHWKEFGYEKADVEGFLGTVKHDFKVDLSLNQAVRWAYEALNTTDYHDLTGYEDFSVALHCLHGTVGINLSGAQVFNLYLAKWALNFVRQARGYKEGTYEKTWSYEKAWGEGADIIGKEDNEVVMELLLDRGEIVSVEDAFVFQTELLDYYDNIVAK